MSQNEPITASLRLRVGSEDAHYGTIAAGAFVMQLFGDLATEITVRRDLSFPTQFPFCSYILTDS